MLDTLMMQQHRGEHRRHQVAGAQRGGGELFVGAGEALGLLRLAHECPHDTDAGDLLAQDAVDPVDTGLHQLERRHHPRHERSEDDDARRGSRTAGSPTAAALAHGPGSSPITRVSGAAIIIVVASTTSIWICWTSLVMRVINDGTPNWPTSRAEYGRDLVEQVAGGCRGRSPSPLGRRSTRRRWQTRSARS